MIRREIEPELIKLAEQFKAVAVIGPRQSGKTTLTRHVFDKKPYFNLENPDSRQFALDDPGGFLFQIPALRFYLSAPCSLFPVLFHEIITSLP